MRCTTFVVHLIFVLGCIAAIAINRNAEIAVNKDERYGEVRDKLR